MSVTRGSNCSWEERKKRGTTKGRRRELLGMNSARYGEDEEEKKRKNKRSKSAKKDKEWRKEKKESAISYGILSTKNNVHNYNYFLK